MVDHVAQANVETEFWCKFEEFKIEITAEADMQAVVEAFEYNGIFSRMSKIETEIYATNQIRTIVIDAACADF